MEHGTITRVFEDKGYGFISMPGSPDLFFHADDLVDELEFGPQLMEQRVQFTAGGSTRGPRAKCVMADS